MKSKKNQPKKYIRTIDELVFAKALLDQKSVTTKPLILRGILQRIEETRKMKTYGGFQTMAYRFLEGLLASQLIEPYYYVEEKEWGKRYQFKIFLVKPECVQQLSEEINNILKICQ